MGRAMADNDDGVNRNVKVRGTRRTLFCRECEFSCIDSIEFTEHQTSVHREIDDSHMFDSTTHIRRSSRINPNCKPDTKGTDSDRKRRLTRRTSGSLISPSTTRDASDKKKKSRHKSGGSIPFVKYCPSENELDADVPLSSLSIDFANNLTGQLALSSGCISNNSSETKANGQFDDLVKRADCIPLNGREDSDSENLISEAEPMTQSTEAITEDTTQELNTDLSSKLDKARTSPDSTSEGINHLQISLINDSKIVSSPINLDHKITHDISVKSPVVNKTEQISDAMSVTSSVYNPATMAESRLTNSSMAIDSIHNESIDDNDSDINEYDSSVDKKSLVARSGSMQTRSYVCVRCSFETTSAKKFLHHQVDCHRENFSIYECSMCDYATKYKQKLPRHYKIHLSASDLMYNSDTASGLNGSDGNGDDLNDSAEEFSPTMVKDTRMTDNLLSGDHGVQLLPKPSPALISVPTASTVVPQRRNPRQEVDPGKYVIVNSEKGIKYACSKCVSVYSWRKSLNKHWKEKHPGEIPDMAERARKMADMEESNNATLNSEQIATSQIPTSVPDVTMYKSNFTHTQPSSTFQPVITNEEILCQENMFKILPQMPNIIGPFITNTTFQPTYNNKSATDALTRLQSQVHSRFSPFQQEKKSPPDPSVLDLSKSSQYKEPVSFKTDVSPTPTPPASSEVQTQPLDFSMKSNPVTTTTTTKLHSAFLLASQLATASQFPFHGPVTQQSILKPEPIWGDDRDASSSPFEIDPDKPSLEGSPAPDINPATDGDSLQCHRCSFKAKTQADFSTHMGIHLSKRAYKCAECQDHFVGVDDLNSHFAKNHADRILEHKEISSKSVTPLQPLSALDGKIHGTTNNSPSCGKNLKCATCGFVAKWPAELQKHSVSHSEERPFICMVCGSTYKWKWDLVKHFEKSHHSLPNPYKRRDPVLAQLTSAINCSQSLINHGDADESAAKKRRISDNNANFLVARFLSSDIAQADKAEFIENLMNNNQEKVVESNAMNNESTINVASPSVQIGRPISENTQKAVSEALRQKLTHTQNVPISTPPPPEKASSDHSSNTDSVLPYRCPFCEYRARWPSEITQHMKNHSNEKPYRCPRCSYRSKWKWDVVKHLKRCGGGTVKDVIDTTKDMSSLVIKDEGLIDGDLLLNSQSTTPQVKYFSSLGLIKKEESEKVEESALAKGKADPVLYTAVINEGKCHCLACPFQAETKSELNKHMILHSENKPFACGSCGYCSKWKGDVKKHLKAYNHTGIIVNPKTKNGENNNIDLESNALKRKLISSNGEEKEMYKCDKCQYITSEKFSFVAHSRIHMQTNSSNPKFKCKQCDHLSADVTAFLMHKITHLQSVSMGSGNPNADSDDLNPQSKCENQSRDTNIKLKHRRKAIGQYKCTKCPYVCFKESSLILHNSMHEPREGDCLKCSYCSYNVSSHNGHLLKQHAQLHERELGSMTDANDMEPHDQRDEDSVMKCEWCDKSFQHLYQLYEHAQVNHPVELRNQTLSPKAKKLCPSEVIDDGSDKSTDSKTSPYQSLKFKNVFAQKRMAKLQCHKCPFVASNMFSYFRHIERHGSNGRHKCFYCDYSIDRLNLLYQHMKGAHLFQSKSLNPSMFAENNNNVKNYVHNDESGGKTVAGGQVDNKMAELKAKLATSGKNNWVWSGEKIETCYVYGKKFYKCSKCDYISNNKQSTEEHYHQHDEKFKCDLCAYSASSLKHIYEHMKIVHELSSDLGSLDMPDIEGKAVSEGDTMSCCYCPYTSQDSESFILHLEMHKSNGNYQCKKCSFSSDDQNIVKDHSEVHNDAEVSTGTEHALQDDKVDANLIVGRLSLNSRIRYRCSACPYFTFCRNNLLKHRRQHLTSSKYKCNFCNYSAMRWYLLQQHLQFHTSQNESDSGLYQDFILDPHDDAMAAELAKLIDERSPMKNSSILKPENAINISSKEEISSGSLKIDESEANDLPSPHQTCCSECPYQANSYTDLLNHSQHHGANLRYRCDACSYSQSLLNLILQHRKLHAKEPGFKPDNVIALLNPNYNGFVTLCDKDTNERNNNHMTTNDGADTDSCASDESSQSTTHICSICQYHTTSSRKFETHIAEHSEKMYTCSRCEWSTDNLDDYYSHCDVHIRESQNRSGIKDANIIRSELELKISANKILYGRKMVRLSREEKFGFACRVCPQRCTKRHQYLHHRLLHRIVSRYTCTECNFSVNCWNLLRQHIELHKTMTSRNKRSVLAMKDRVKCPKCPYHVHSRDLLAAHKTLHSLKRYNCELCGYSCLDQSKMHIHMAQMHSMTTGGSPNTPDTSLKVYEASVPEISSDKLYFGRTDMNSDIGSSKSSPETMQAARADCITCPYCSVFCGSITELREHIQLHFTETPNQSLNISSAYANRGQPNKQKVTQSFASPTPSGVTLLSSPIKTKIYLCQYCDREFEDKELMRSHEKQHLIG